MKISYKWLCEIMPGLNQFAADEIAHKLTMSGLELEEFTDLAQKFKNIVVAEVIAKEKHPDADKLNLCTVKAGSHQMKLVCGAPNVAVGKKYPLALLGAVMPDGLQIKKVRIRGVESTGMLCSEKELGLSDEASGLLELDAGFKDGQDIASALGLDDIIIEINVTPNRGDALSHWGVACDVSALTGIAVQYDRIVPEALKLQSVSEAVNEPVQVEIKAPEACGRFSASQIKGVKIGPSPLWLKSRLQTLGHRSINNVVDATNYVLLLTGHPVHAYDERDISQKQISVQVLSADQKYTTLDDQVHELLVGDLVICDAKGPVALAGIMGGQNSEIKNDTRDVILEVAFFNPDNIRKTARRLGLQTDSSYRFERFVNPQTVLNAHQILRDLILHLAGGTATKILDVYPHPYTAVTIELSDQEIERILGIQVPQTEVVKILSGLNCKIKTHHSAYTVEAPIGRSDLTREIDLIEEIARLYGLDKITPEMPRLRLRTATESESLSCEAQVKNYFVQQGFNETVHYSFTDAAYMAKVLNTSDHAQWLSLKNPISEDLGVMRTSLLPQLLQTYIKNVALSDQGLRFFELRSVYCKKSDEKIVESLKLCGLYQGNVMGRNRFGMARSSDLFDGKGWLQSLFKLARIETEQSPYHDWPYHPGQSLQFLTANKQIATLGALHPELLQQLKIKSRLFYFEIDFDFFASQFQKVVQKFSAINPLPSVYRDLALLVPKNVTFAAILGLIDQEGPRHLKDIALFDLYEGPNLPDDKKSLGFSMRYEPDQKSLTDEDVNQMHFKLVDTLKDRLGVELR